MVAPLYVPGVVLEERVHDDMGPRSAVVDVAQDMELVDGQPVDDVADGNDEVVGPSGRDDCIDDDGDVGSLVVVVGPLVKQFLDDVAEVIGQRLAHLGAGVFRRDVATDLDELVNGDVIPVVHILLHGLHQFEFLLGVVDESAEFLLLGLANGVAEDFGDFALDVARSILDYVLKGLMLAVKVGEEVLGPLRQVEDGLQVDDFGGGTRHVGVAVG